MNSSIVHKLFAGTLIVLLIILMDILWNSNHPKLLI